jgi:Tol biopolymer transport system component
VGHHEGNPEVYVLDVASGDLTNVSNSLLDDYDPLWSPDGHYLAFRRRDSYGHIHAVVRDLTADTEVELPITISSYAPMPWSPDSQHLFLTGNSDGMWCVIVYGVYSATSQNLACRDTYYATTLSPDTRWMLVEWYETEVELVDLESGRSRALNEVGYIDAEWAPDSHTFAYRNEDRSAICIYDVSVHRSKCLILPKTDGRSSIIGWSPTGQLAWAEEGFPAKFYVMEPNTDTFREIATIDKIPPAQVVYPYSRVWSPRGHFIGFTTYAGAYALDTVTGTLHNPVYGRGYIQHLQWSPDGQYMSASLSTGEVAVAHLSTGEVSLLENLIAWRHIDWAPDGTRFVGVCGDYLATNLCLVELP